MLDNRIAATIPTRPGGARIAQTGLECAGCDDCGLISVPERQQIDHLQSELCLTVAGKGSASVVAATPSRCADRITHG